MEKRKALSKGRLLKQKNEINKTNIDQFTSETFAKISKLQQIQDTTKKSSTPTRLSKSKILNKRLPETPKLTFEDLEVKRKSVPNTQENLESYYNSYIKSLTTKLEKHKSHNEDLEEELKQMEITFKLEENTLKKEIERLTGELRRLKNDKMEQETELMEENFRIRRQFEEYKSNVTQCLIDVKASAKNEGKDLEEIVKRFEDFNCVKEELHVGFSLKDTASFSQPAGESNSPKAVIKSGFKEAIALHSYSSNNGEEISLNPGDRVIVFNSDETNGWWIGKVGENIGKFPRNCVMLD